MKTIDLKQYCREHYELEFSELSKDERVELRREVDELEQELTRLDRLDEVRWRSKLEGCSI